MPRRVFLPKPGEERRDWRKLRNEEPQISDLKQITEEEFGGACSTYEGDEKFVGL
jgi:hypothetical protein